MRSNFGRQLAMLALVCWVWFDFKKVQCCSDVSDIFITSQICHSATELKTLNDVLAPCQAVRLRGARLGKYRENKHCLMKHTDYSREQCTIHLTMPDFAKGTVRLWTMNELHTSNRPIIRFHGIKSLLLESRSKANRWLSKTSCRV